MPHKSQSNLLFKPIEGDGQFGVLLNKREKLRLGELAIMVEVKCLEGSPGEIVGQLSGELVHLSTPVVPSHHLVVGLGVIGHLATVELLHPSEPCEAEHLSNLLEGAMSFVVRVVGAEGEV